MSGKGNGNGTFFNAANFANPGKGGGLKSMAGTEGTDEYFPVIETPLADVGYRQYDKKDPSKYRIRVQPKTEDAAAMIAAEYLPRERSYLQPGDRGQNRFSTMTNGAEQTYKELCRCLRAACHGVIVANVKVSTLCNKVLLQAILRAFQPEILTESEKKALETEKQDSAETIEELRRQIEAAESKIAEAEETLATD